MVARAPYRIGFIVDHPTRDLTGGILLAAALARRGIETALVPQYEQGVDVPLLALDALVVNYARPVNLELVESFAAAGIAVYVLDTEGGVLAERGHSSPERLAAYVRDSGYGGALAGYLFWGPVLHRAFVENGAMPPERLHLTGCPRFDPYAPALRELEPARRRGHVLINTNYPLVNPKFVKGPGGDRAAVSSVGYDDAFIDRLFASTAEVMAAVVATVERLSRDLPDQPFVLRPHPFENPDTYHRSLGGLPNVTVDPSGPVFDALHGARALLHLNCGTAIEALMLGVPPLALEFANVDTLRDHASLPSRASLGVASYDELVARLRGDDPGAGLDIAAKYEEVAAPYFYRNDGLAAERVAEVLAAGCAAREAEPPRPRLGLSLAASRPSPRLSQRLQSWTANLVGSAAAGAARAALQPIRKGKEFAPSEIAGRLAALAAFRDEAAPLACRARHPLTGVPLASTLVAPARATQGLAA